METEKKSTQVTIKPYKEAEERADKYHLLFFFDSKLDHLEESFGQSHSVRQQAETFLQAS